MAHFELRRDMVPRLPILQAIARFLDTPFDRRSREIALRVAELRALSRAELARRGLRRRDILPYVLRNGRG